MSGVWRAHGAGDDQEGSTMTWAGCRCGCGDSQPCEWDPLSPLYVAQQAIEQAEFARREVGAQRLRTENERAQRCEREQEHERKREREREWVRELTARKERQKVWAKAYRQRFKSVWGCRVVAPDPIGPTPLVEYSLWVPRVTVTLDDYDRTMH